jgi:hypothetical protein
VRTALGVAGLAFLIVIFVAGSNDVIAADTATGLQAISALLRIAAFVLPILSGWITYRLMVRLRDSHEPVTANEPTDT